MSEYSKIDSNFIMCIRNQEIKYSDFLEINKDNECLRHFVKFKPDEKIIIKMTIITSDVENLLLITNYGKMLFAKCNKKLLVKQDLFSNHDFFIPIDYFNIIGRYIYEIIFKNEVGFGANKENIHCVVSSKKRMCDIYFAVDKQLEILKFSSKYR